MHHQPGLTFRHHLDGSTSQSVVDYVVEVDSRQLHGGVVRPPADIGLKAQRPPHVRLRNRKASEVDARQELTWAADDRLAQLDRQPVSGHP